MISKVGNPRLKDYKLPHTLTFQKKLVLMGGNVGRISKISSFISRRIESHVGLIFLY
jgi:hypothetical protein